MSITRLLSPATVTFLVLLAVGDPRVAAAQDPASSRDMKVSIYPVLVWVPAFSATTNVPPYPDTPGGPDLPGGSGSTSTSFDGAFLAGF